MPDRLRPWTAAFGAMCTDAVANLASDAGALDRDVLVAVLGAVDAGDDGVGVLLGDADVGVRVAQADRADPAPVTADRSREQRTKVIGGHTVLLAQAHEQPGLGAVGRGRGHGRVALAARGPLGLVVVALGLGVALAALGLVVMLGALGLTRALGALGLARAFGLAVAILAMPIRLGIAAAPPLVPVAATLGAAATLAGLRLGGLLGRRLGGGLGDSRRRAVLAARGLGVLGLRLGGAGRLLFGPGLPELAGLRGRLGSPVAPGLAVAAVAAVAVAVLARLALRRPRQ